MPLLQTLTSDPATDAGGGLVGAALAAALTGVPHEHRLAAIVGAMFVAVCLKNLIGYANFAAFLYVDARIGHDLRVRLFERMLAMPLAEVESDRSGRLLNVLETETWRTSQALNVLFGAITSACTAVVFVPLLFLLSWPLTLFALLSVGVIPIVVAAITREVKATGEGNVAANNELATRLWASLNGLRVIHSFGRERFELARFTGASRAARDLSLRLALITARNGPATEILITAIIAAAALLVGAGLVDVATLAAFVVILYRLQPRIRELVAARVALLGYQGSVLEVMRLAGIGEPEAPPSTGRACPTLADAIRFEAVTFRYREREGGAPALDKVSFEIRRGTTVAVVGPSGAGKSTLLDLLLRFREPQGGRITVDGTPLAELDPAAWRGRLAVVSQDPYVFDDTVRFNILYGRPDATDAEMVAAAKLALAHDFVSALPHGYETPVGERGVRLSGGQRQRLALARAMLRRPDLLLLDEATNALDSLTEQAVQQALARFAHDRTILIIAHRLSTIEKADHIVVLDHGWVVEQGDFPSLVARNGLFARMRRLQSLAGTEGAAGSAVRAS
jgi:subfamily B ATP-binding cassette protein MsbA